MHIQEYIPDPNKSAQENQQEHDFYTNKLNNIMGETKKTPSVTIYNENDDLWFHFKIPDEEMRTFYYDVVFVFYPNSKLDIDSPDIYGYDVKFFSNDPGFMYKYCYEFNKSKLIVDPLKTRLSSRALTEPAKVMNPNHELRYPKTIFFAYLVMENLGLFQKKNIQAHGVTKLTRSFFVQSIQSSVTIYNKRQTRDKTTKGINKLVNNITKPIEDMGNKITKKISTIGQTKSIGSSKRTSTSKKVKRK